MDTVTESTEVNGPRKYRRRTQEEKRQIVEETLSSGRSVAEVARIHAVNANQVFDWRKQYLEGRFGADTRECALLPVTVSEVSDSSLNEPAACTPAASAPGTGRNRAVKGSVLWPHLCIPGQARRPYQVPVLA